MAKMPPKIREQVGAKKTTYLARVRRNGVVDTATFESLEKAKDWITQQEAKIIRGEPISLSKIKRLSLVSIFDEYIKEGEINDEQKARVERLKLLMKDLSFGDFTSHSFGIFLTQMKAMDVPRPKEWKKPHPYFNGSMVEIDGKMVRRKMAESTIRKYYYAIRTCFQFHSKKHNYHFDVKPFKENPPPKAWTPRTRIVEEENNELEMLLNACDKMYVNQEHLKEIIQFQIHSAMRMGETIKMKFSDIFLNENEPWKSYIFIPRAHIKTRNHDSTEDRKVMMVPNLVELIKTKIFPRMKSADDLVFPFWKTSSTLSKRMRVIWKNSGVKNMKAHDFRHTGVTKLFSETNLSDIEISKISGHTDLNTLKRYHSQRPSSVGEKMWKSMGALEDKTV